MLSTGLFEWSPIDCDFASYMDGFPKRFDHSFLNDNRILAQ